MSTESFTQEITSGVFLYRTVETTPDAVTNTFEVINHS